MKLLFALVVLVIFAAALLASYQRRPFPLLVDAKANEAQANLLVAPCPLTPQNIPTIPPDRKV